MKKSIAYAMRYDDLGASSRIRHLAWAQRMQQAGFPVFRHAFFSNVYLRKLYSGHGQSKAAWVWGTIRRIFWLIFKAPRNLVVEYELLPYVPWFIERIFWIGRKVVLDFDDNVGVRYKNNPLLRGKFDSAAKAAAAVTVANDFLYTHYSKFNSNIVKIPTLINTPEKMSDVEKFPVFTLVWIGTPVTYSYIEHFAETFQFLAGKINFQLLVIAGKSLEKRAVPGVNMTFSDWSESKAAELMARSHAGIMPLTDDEFSCGKSAFKLIQYLGAGLPAIASGVGENLKVVKHGVTGFIADTPEEWLKALETLAGNSQLRQEMGENARRYADGYTYNSQFATYTGTLTAAFNSK